VLRLPFFKGRQGQTPPAGRLKLGPAFETGFTNHCACLSSGLIGRQDLPLRCQKQGHTWEGVQQDLVEAGLFQKLLLCRLVRLDDPVEMIHFPQVTSSRFLGDFAVISRLLR
jgi:hypothetical protein